MEDSAGICDAKVFKVDDSVWKEGFNGFDEAGDESVVGLTADSTKSVSHIERVVDKGVSVSSYVEDDRDASAWMDTSAESHEGQFSDGDADTAGTLVADAENRFTVADNDVVDILGGTKGGESVFDLLRVLYIKEATFRAAELVGVVFDSLALGGSIDDAKDFRDMTEEEFVVEDFVLGFEGGAEGIFGEVGRVSKKLLVGAVALFLWNGC